MGHLEKIPLEFFHLITLSLDVYDLYHLLVLFPTCGLYHQLRRVLSNQGRLVALLYAIHLGSLDLIERIPHVSQLISRFDDYARYANIPTRMHFLVAMIRWPRNLRPPIFEVTSIL
jgi:hypothetical protein